MGVALAAGFSAYCQFALANVASVRQVRALRVAFVKALLRQDVSWADAHPPGDMASRLVEDTVAIEDGLGAKLTLGVQGLTTFLAGIILAFTLSWKMSLVLLGFIPVLGGVMAFVSSKLIGSDKKGADAYADAGEVATEALSNVRTVAAYGGEADAAKRYDAALAKAEKEGVRKATLTGVTIGTMLLVLFTVYGVSLLWGAQLVLWSRSDNVACIYDPTLSGCFTGGTVLQVLFALIMGAGALGQMAPSITAVTSARAAAARVFDIIDRVPPIDSAAPTKSTATPPVVTGRIEFRGVTFAYPSRPTVNVLQNFSLTIESGENVALVGPSGCGKSTLVALIQRWYDVNEGAVLVDGVDVREWDVQALRAAQAIVSQESLLLTGSVAHNIALGSVGLLDSAASEDVDAAARVDRASIEAAAAGANAAVFIEALPKKYEEPLTNTSLSGGQRQRLCIARALLRTRVPILLLDEATSALDTASEQLVQVALDALVSGSKRTTVTIAHRLSTIENAHRVIVISDGKIVEQGPPAELLAKEDGVFKKMRAAQALAPLDESAAVASPSTEEAPKAAPNADTADVTATAKTDVPDSKAAAVDPKAADAVATPTAKDPKVALSRVLSYNAPELGIAILGFLACCVTGVTMPGFALLLSRFIALYYDPDNSSLWAKALMYMGSFIAIGVGNFIACIIQQWAFGLIGERLVRRVRSAAFGALLRFEVSWHDSHAPGAVTAALGADAYLLKSSSGTNLALTVQNLIGLISGLIIAFIASWRITLVVLAIAPLMALGGALQIKYITSSTDASKAAFQESGAIATEALGAPRTLAAYALQDAARAAFARAVAKPTAANAKGAWASGIGMSLMATMMIGT